MYVTKITCGKYVYVKLIEGYRDGKRVRHRVVKNFGRLDALEKEDPNAFEKLKAQFDSKNADRQAAALARAEKARSILSTYLGDASIERELPLLRYGHYALKAIWEGDLALKQKIDYEQKVGPAVDFNFNSVISHLVFQKAMNPASVLSTFQQQDEYLGAPLQGIPLDACYQALDFLKENKDGLFKWVNRQMDKKFGRDRASLVFYDVTNAYFETPLTDAEKGLLNQDFIEYLEDEVRKAIATQSPELDVDAITDENGAIDLSRVPRDFIENLSTDELPAYQRMRGPSKEHRTDLPLVSVALVIDKNGIPMDFEVFAGNSSEFKTMATAIAKLKTKHSLQDAIVVADRGLNSTDNLSMLQKKKLGFLMAQKVSQFSGEIRRKMLDLDAYSPINPENPNGAKFRTIENWKRKGASGNSIECTLVLTWDAKRKARDEAILDVWVDLVRKRKGQKLSSRRPAWAAIAETDDKAKERIITGIDEKAVEARRQLCGFAAMVYDDAPEEKAGDEAGAAGECKPRQRLDGREIASQYHRLNQIEDCFRVMKSNIGLRPMFVRTSNHIKGHVTLCVLALLMLRLIQIRLKEKDTPMSINTLCRTLHEATLMAQEGGTDGLTFFRCSYGERLRKGRERMKEEDLLALVKTEGQRNHLKEILGAVGLTLPPTACSTKELATCLRTRFKKIEDAIPMLRRI